ncbi:AAA family ATPase [Methylobacterium platani]|uniref:AAA+ ATPase domain-containing protein n=2 Tax=Methylobacterium platani TaxID=427683 RepID=A0A179S5R7_9HYPH|nr:AAA family ATPase [Methylobacterium platani]KMO22403.1 hypothetical protein SQ03_00535 [Methylobacterium platani JCM 14648]OAS22486.1 hypothetical protein A5481_19005 [Methylobacterium platani]
MNTDAHDRAEGLSAHAIMRGDAPAASRRDPNPFIPLIALLALLCPVTPDLREPDEGLDAEDDRYAGMLWSACAIRDHLLSSTCDFAVARIQVATLSAAAALLAKSLDAEPMSILDVSAERAVTGTVQIAQIADVCLAGCGDRDALVRLAEAAETCAALCASGYQAFATGARHILATQEDLGEWRPGQPPIPVIGTAIQVGRNALARLEHEGGRATERPTHAEEMDDDRAGIVRHTPSAPKPVPVKPAPAAAPEPQGPGVVVFPADVAEAVGKGDNRREVERFLGKALGARLSLIPVPENWDYWENAVNTESPWLAPLTRAVRLSQGNRTHWGHAVICAVGAPGSGKTYHARRIAQVSKLPFARINCEATSDNAMGGTSIRWQTRHPSFVERLLAGEGKASGMALLDELEKSAGGRRSNGGDPLDLLHGWFEVETARAWRSTYLLSEVDLSHVVFLCTANSLDGLPSSLVDRMTVVKVNEPGPEHLHHLAQILAFETCRQAGQDIGFGWLEDIEFAALADAWRGGSIRRLRRLVEAVLRARESGPAAMPRH